MAGLSEPTKNNGAPRQRESVVLSEPPSLESGRRSRRHGAAITASPRNTDLQ